MPRRIDIELTTALADDAWTWRAAGAKKPNGVVSGIGPPRAGSKVGDVLEVEMEQMLDGVEILSVVKGRVERDHANVLEILPTSEPFQEVIETRVPAGATAEESQGATVTARATSTTTAHATIDRRVRMESRRAGDRRPPRHDRPHFEAPPEVPQRPKPKRLGPAEPVETRCTPAPRRAATRRGASIQGMAAVRTRVKSRTPDSRPRANRGARRGRVGGRGFLPKLRVAEWLDRAEAAQRQMADIELGDLRSVFSPAKTRSSPTTRPICAVAWSSRRRTGHQAGRAAPVVRRHRCVHRGGPSHSSIEAVVAAAQGRSVFPTELARRLGEAATNALQPDDTADRWIAVLEAAAFSPVRSLVEPDERTVDR